MDFCVKCGKKQIYDESLCSKCYEHEYPLKKKKVKLRKEPLARHPDYYEAILQVRNPDKATLKFVEDKIKRRKIGLAKLDKVKNGYDYYLADIKFTQKLGKFLQKRFGGLIKSSAKLFSVSRITSKKIYRVTILYKRPPFKVGDSVMIKGEKVKVKRLGKEMIGVLESGKKVKYKFKALEKLKAI